MVQLEYFQHHLLPLNHHLFQRHHHFHCHHDQLLYLLVQLKLVRLVHRHCLRLNRLGHKLFRLQLLSVYLLRLIHVRVVNKFLHLLPDLLRNFQCLHRRDYVHELIHLDFRLLICLFRCLFHLKGHRKDFLRLRVPVDKRVFGLVIQFICKT